MSLGPTVFVAGLHRNVTAVEVRRHVEAAHQRLRVTNVFLARSADGTPTGHASVTVATDAERDRLLATGVPALAGRPLTVPPRAVRPRIQPPRRHAHLFVRNLSRHMSEEDIQHHIATVAPVAAVRLPRNDFGRPTGWAFIDLEDAADVPRVVAALDGVALGGRPLHVQVCRNPVDPDA